MKKRITSALLCLLAACGSEDGSEYVQQKISSLEPANHTLETANEITPAYAYSPLGASSGVYGDLQAGETDYYYVDIDFFDSGDHTISLTDLSDDLDLEVIDWEGNIDVSEASGTTDEVITSISTTNVGYFSEEDIDTVRIIMKVKGGSETASSRFTLSFSTIDVD